MVRYQFPDPANPATLLEGGILQFAATLAVPPESLDQLKQAVIDKFPGTRPEEIRLSGMPLKSAKVSLLSPQVGGAAILAASGGWDRACHGEPEDGLLT